MKKFIASCLVLIMTFTLLSACGGTQQETGGGGGAGTGTTVADGGGAGTGAGTGDEAGTGGGTTGDGTITGGTPAPGGTNPDVAPIPTDPTSILIASEDGTMWFEFDENGVPLGAWTWDDATEMWIFDENVPLAYFPVAPVGASALAGIATGLMPQTGLDSFATTLGLLLVFALAIAAGSLTLIKRETKRN